MIRLGASCASPKGLYMKTVKELDGGQIEAQFANQQAELDELDKRLLSIIQSGFPIEPRPYAVLGEQLGISEKETQARVLDLREKKIIRRLGANFQSAKLGFRSTLCAAKVPQEKMELFIADVNKRQGVTHNYLRNHAYNIWFTVIAPSLEATLEELDGITAATGVKILNLPATRVYKIKVDFKLA